jgi:hypothetical protein
MQNRNRPEKLDQRRFYRESGFLLFGCHVLDVRKRVPARMSASPNEVDRAFAAMGSTETAEVGPVAFTR